jgi:hypothetical protein
MNTPKQKTTRIPYLISEKTDHQASNPALGEKAKGVRGWVSAWQSGGFLE